MDYIPTNISARGQRQGQYHQTTLGPYDYWAIEYAYKPIAASTPDEELPELAKIAARASEPLLAYDTDEDAGIGGGPFDMDPAVNQKEALELLREHLFSPRAFQFSPQLLNKLASPRFSDFSNFLSMRTRFDVPIHDMVLSLQNQVLERLFHPLVLGRILDSEV